MGRPRDRGGVAKSRVERFDLALVGGPVVDETCVSGFATYMVVTDGRLSDGEARWPELATKRQAGWRV